MLNITILTQFRGTKQRPHHFQHLKSQPSNIVKYGLSNNKMSPKKDLGKKPNNLKLRGGLKDFKLLPPFLLHRFRLTKWIVMQEEAHFIGFRTKSNKLINKAQARAKLALANTWGNCTLHKSRAPFPSFSQLIVYHAKLTKDLLWQTWRFCLPLITRGFSFAWGNRG